MLLVLAYTYMRKQWLQYLRKQTLAETSDLVVKGQELDTVIAGVLTLVQEVEVVSRGYKM